MKRKEGKKGKKKKEKKKVYEKEEEKETRSTSDQGPPVGNSYKKADEALEKKMLERGLTHEWFQVN